MKFVIKIKNLKLINTINTAKIKLIDKNYRNLKNNEVK